MPTLYKSVQIAQKMPSLSADGYEPVCVTSDFVTVAGMVINDVIEMAILPAGYVPVDLTIATDDLDSNVTPTITLDAGIFSGTAGLSDNARTCGNEALAASTVAQAGGLARQTKPDFSFIAPTTADRGIGIKLAAAAATLVVGARVRLVLWMRPALNGV